MTNGQYGSLIKAYLIRNVLKRTHKKIVPVGCFGGMDAQLSNFHRFLITTKLVFLFIFQVKSSYLEAVCGSNYDIVIESKYNAIEYERFSLMGCVRDCMKKDDCSGTIVCSNGQNVICTLLDVSPTDTIRCKQSQCTFYGQVIYN